MRHSAARSTGYREPFTYFGPSATSNNRLYYNSSGGSSTSSIGSDGFGVSRRRQRQQQQQQQHQQQHRYWTPQDYLRSPMFDCLQHQRKPWSSSSTPFHANTIRLSSLGVHNLSLGKKSKRLQLGNCKVL